MVKIAYFGFITDCLGRRFYFTAEQRNNLSRLKNAQFDSHSYIAMFYKVDIDKCDKFWWDPTNGLIEIQLNTSRATESTYKWVLSHSFLEIVNNFNFFLDK